MWLREGVIVHCSINLFYVFVVSKSNCHAVVMLVFLYNAVLAVLSLAIVATGI